MIIDTLKDIATVLAIIFFLGAAAWTWYSVFIDRRPFDE